jgi:hypothetical protein
MEIDEIMNYIREHGEPPEDNLHYMPVDPLFLEEVLANCIVFTVETHKNYTEILFRHINNVDWFSLRVKGASSFEVARFAVKADGTTKFAIHGEKLT